MKHKKLGATVAPVASQDDTSWLDGKTNVVVNVEEKQDAPSLIKILSLRQGAVTLQDGRVLRYHKTLDVNEETATWLFKSFPGLMEKL
jgi:hypothetical protein